MALPEKIITYISIICRAHFFCPAPSCLTACRT